MKINELVSVAVRIFGLLWLIYIIRETPYWYQAITLSHSDQKDEIIYYLIVGSHITQALIALFMIKFPGVVSLCISTKSDGDKRLIEENGEAIQLAGFTILGAYVLTFAIPDLLHNCLILFSTNQNTSYGSLYDPVNIKISIAVTVLEIIVALFLFLGSQGIIKALRKFRSM